MRTKAEIEREVKDVKKQLNNVIKCAVELEKENDDVIEELNQEIVSLNKEISYESTLAGQTDQLTDDTINTIRKLLNDLEQKTGVKIRFKLQSDAAESIIDFRRGYGKIDSSELPSDPYKYANAKGGF